MVHWLLCPERLPADRSDHGYIPVGVIMGIYRYTIVTTITNTVYGIIIIVVINRRSGTIIHNSGRTGCMLLVPVL